MRRQLKNRNLYLMILSDTILFAIALTAAYLFRFEFRLDQVEISQIKTILVWLIPVKLIIFFSFEETLFTIQSGFNRKPFAF